MAAIKEFELHPPDVGTITEHYCGCLTWTSRKNFICLACSADCPRLAAMTKIARDKSVPVDYRPAWSS